SRADVQNHRRRTPLSHKALLYVVLQDCIDVQLDQAASFPLSSGKLLHNPAQGIDLELAGARTASQEADLGSLHTILADPQARQLQHGILLADQILFRNCPYVADDMRQARSEGVVACLPDLNADARKIRSIDRYTADFIPSQAVPYPNRHERAETSNVPLNSLPILLAALDDQPQAFQNRTVNTRLFGDQQDLVILPIDRDGDTLAVDDLAARRGQKPQGDAVVFGKQPIAFCFQNLKLVEAPHQSR